MIDEFPTNMPRTAIRFPPLFGDALGKRKLSLTRSKILKVSRLPCRHDARRDRNVNDGDLYCGLRRHRRLAAATVGGNMADVENWTDILQIPELPRAGQRWTVQRKAAVVEAVRGGWMPIDEACALYNISIDEFLAWERDLDRYGVHGLRTTRYQIYRDTEKKSA
jgi:hypothetical protein